MELKEERKPIYQDKEGHFKLSIFRNVNSKNVKYPMICLTRYAFPFKYNQKMYFSPKEVPKLLALLERTPEIQIEENDKKTKSK